MVNGEMRSPGISQELELKRSATNGLDLKATPDPPGGSAQAKHLTHVHLHRAFTRQWVGLGKIG